MKKWTYLVAAGMMLGATPVFTGCIDNDEPEGISILRGAKAELLKAKASVEAAKVAQVQAEAALAQAKAKVKEAEATKIEAEAKKIEAEAKIAEAKAALINAKSERERAEAQAIIEANERAQKEWEEKAAVRAAEAEAAIKEAEYKALKARAEYQTALVTLQSAQEGVLASYITKLDNAMEAYFDALDALRKAQREMNKQEVAIEESEATKDLKTRDLQKELNTAVAELAGAEKALEVAKEELAEAKKLTPAPLQVKLQELVDKENSINKEIADLSVKAAETVAEFYANGRLDEVDKLLNEYYEAMGVSQAFAAVDFDFGDGSGYPAFMPRGIYTLPEAEYNFYNVEVAYENRLSALNRILAQFQSWTRDANDDAWTTEGVAKMEYQLEQLEKEITTAKTAWKEAAEAFKTGKYPDVNANKISGYNEVVAEIAKFNAVAEAVNKAHAEVVRLVRKEVTDRNTRDEALAQNIEDEAAAKAKAGEIYRAAMENIDKVVEANTKALKATWDAAVKEVETKQAALDKANEGTDAAITAAKNALKAAEKAEVEAAEKYYDYVANGYIEEVAAIEEAKDTADRKAEADHAAADTAANKAYDTLWNAATGTDALALAAANAKVTEEEVNMTKAATALSEVSTIYNNNISEVSPAPINLYDIQILSEGIYDAESGYYVRRTDLTDSKLIQLDKEGLKWAVRTRSNKLYGTSFDQNQYGDEYARLEELTDDEILAAVKETITKVEEVFGNTTLSDYQDVCRSYGLVGKRLALMEQIRIANSWLNNKDIIAGKIAQAEEAIDELTTAYEEYNAAIEAKVEAYDLALETLNADFEATIEPITAKRKELKPLQDLYRAIEHAISDYETAGEVMWDEVNIQRYIKTCEAIVQECEEGVFDAETARMEAQDKLDKWNSEAITWLEILKERVEDAQAKVDRKKKVFDDAQAALDAVLARLSAE